MIIYNITQSELNRKIEEENLKIICFGTGVMAKEALSNSVIAKHVIAFADNDCKKQGLMFSYKGIEAPIIGVHKLGDYKKDNAVVLIASSHFEAISRQIEAGVSANIDIYVYPLIRLNLVPDSKEFFEERMVKEAQKEYETVLSYQEISSEEKSEKLSKLTQDMWDNFEKSKKTAIIPRMMIMPTTKCNMRCRDCSSLLPYFDNPRDLPIEQLIRDLDIFFSAIDRCIRLTIGGEPFLYPHLQPLLEYLISQPKLDGILMITNSTLLPKPEIFPLLRSEKVFIEISDYGHIERMSRLVAAFEKEEVKFMVITEQKWTDMGKPENMHKDAETLRYEYLNCEQGRVIKGIFDGKLYICARSARMHALGTYHSEHDYIVFSEKDTIEETQIKLNRIYFEEYADACNYCNCGKFPTKVIPAGVQLTGNFRMSRYTLVDREEYEELKRKQDIYVSE